MSLSLVYLKKISKSFGPKKLLDAISLPISKGECFALIGENGSGKTTLLRLIAGLDVQDSGVIERCKNLSIGFLSQELSSESLKQTVRDYLFSHLRKIENEMTTLQDKLDDPTILERWSELHEEFVHRGGYRTSKEESTLAGIDMSMSVEELSSGERRRLELTKALLYDPDLLLLDEPTNHLDDKGIKWLKEELQKRDGATIIVSHDRKFLNETCNRLIELRNKQITRFGGSYDFYLGERKRLIDQQIKAFEEQEKERATLIQQIRAMTYSRGKPSRPKDRDVMAYDKRGEYCQQSVQHKLDQLKERLKRIENNLLVHPKPRSVTGIVFHDSSFSAPVAIKWENLSKSFDEKTVFSGQTGELFGKERLIVTGPNGSGKTTFMKCLLQHLTPDSGNVYINPSVRIGYLDQEGESLPLEQNALGYFSEKFGLDETGLRSELHKTGLSGGENLFRIPFGFMSAGQRKRLMILSLVLSKPNVLLLDEPTNHLDLLTLEALEQALLGFSGAVLAISHDETFIEKIATRRVVI